MYFTIRLKNVLREHQESLDYYLVEAVKQSDIKNLEEDVSKMEVSLEILDQVRNVVTGLESVAMEETENGVKIKNSVHKFDLGRLMASLSMNSGQRYFFPRSTSSKFNSVCFYLVPAL